jgi:tripartite-type tricarboxylate transporter receptor subunit TctC
MKRTLIFSAATMAGLAIAAPAMAQSVADHYKSRTVTILVGYGAGGTYGQTSLLLAQHIGDHIPGNPTVIVQHMPGAGGIKMTNYAYNVMPKNGHFFMMPPEMSVVSQLLRPKRVKYVTTGFTWLGTVFGANQVMIVRRDTGIKSLADLTKKQIIVASTGKGSPTYLVPAMMNGVLKTKFKIVTGYKGSAGTSLSVEQGETFGMTNSWVSWTANRPQWFKGKSNDFALKLLQVGFNKEPDLPNLPLLTDLATTPDDRAASAMLSTASIIGRGLALPPGVPKNLVEPLRTAFAATVVDPKFLASAKKRKLPVIPIKGAVLQKTIVDAIATMSPSAIATAKKYLFGK